MKDAAHILLHGAALDSIRGGVFVNPLLSRLRLSVRMEGDWYKGQCAKLVMKRANAREMLYASKK